MRPSRQVLRPLLAFLLLLQAWAGAAVLAPGVEHLTYTLPDPNVVHVIKIARAQTDIDLVMGFPHKRRNYPSRENVQQIAARYEAPPAVDVLAAVNAGFFGSGNDIIGNLGSENNYIQLPDLSRNWPVFALLDGANAFVAMNPGITDNQLRFADTSSLGIDILNEDRIADSLVVYTPDWGPSTGTTAQGVEVILQGVNFPLRINKHMSGVVSAVRTGTASLNNAIPAGGIVLSARDSKAATLQGKVAVGDRVTFRLALSGSILNNTRLITDGAGYFVREGTAYPSGWSGFSAGFVGRNPRTFIAINDTHLFLGTVDGRQTGYSVGMSFTEMAAFCVDTLGVREAVNLDGGGSTTMVVDGTIVNRPSDGSPRAVGNAIMAVRRTQPLPRQYSDTFPASGRQLPWDDKFTFNGVESFSPPSPGGDGHVIKIADPAGGFEIVRIGTRADTTVNVEADIYCDYRPGDAGNGYERYGLFARDQGQAAFVSTSYGGANSYIMTYDSHDGRLRAGKVVNGTFTDFREADPLILTNTAWRRFRIVCSDANISYYIDGQLVASVTDDTFRSGYAGIGFHEFFANNALMRGTRADNFTYAVQESPAIDAWQVE